MASESITIERLICDRCRRSEDIKSGDVERRDEWSYVQAETKQGGTVLQSDYTIDLCPICTKSLRNWSCNPNPTVQGF